MAQRQYQPAARGRGFNSIAVSDANISRMQEESNRIIQGMQTRRNAELENRKQQLQDMKEDAAYYEKVRRRDFDIASTNTQNQQRQIQFNEAERVRKAREATEGAAKIFGEISAFSATAAKEQQKLREQEREKEKQQGFAAAQAGLVEYHEKQLVWKEKANQLDQTSEKLDAAINVAAAQGKGDPLSIAKSRKMSSSFQEGAMQGIYARMVQTEYASFINRKLAESGLGNDTAATAGLLADSVQDFFNEKGLGDIGSDVLGPAIREAARINNTIVANTSKLETDQINADIEREQTNYAYGNPVEYAGSAFRRIASIRGPEYAHEWYKKLSTAQNPEDGTFVLSDEQWQNIDIYETKDAQGNIIAPGKKGSYLLDHAARSLEIRNLRKQKEREYIQGEATDSRLSWQKESLDAWKLYQQEPTRETLAAIEEGFSDNPEGLPDWLVREKEKLDPANAPYKQQLILTAKDAKERGMLTQELITEIYSFDPKLGNELQASYDAQNPVVNNPNFKAQLKAVQGFVKKPSASVPFPSDSNDSVRASRILGTELERNTVKLAAQYGGSAQAIIQASDEAAAALQAKIIKDSTNPQGRYYRVYNPVTGLFSFPNLSDVPISQTQRSKEQSRQFAQAMQSGRQQELINTKFGVLTESELISEVKRVSRPGYVPNMKLVMASKGVEGGLVAVLNKQIKLSGLAGLKPIQPPESLQRVGAYSPAAQRHLSRYLNADVSTRVHGFEGGKLNLEWNRHLVPAQYRESIEKHAKTYGVPAALISAKLEVESTWGLNRTSPAGAKGIAQFTPETAQRFGVNVNSDDSSIEGAAKYLKFLLNKFNNDPIIAAGAYNSGEGAMERHLRNPTANPLPAETVNHMKKVSKALYKYSGDKRLLQRPETIRSGFQVVQYVSGDPSIRGMNTGAVIYDPEGHGGQSYHNHYEFKTKAQAEAAKRKFEENGFRVTSYLRPGDPGAHGKGYAIDVAPPLDLPRTDAAEAEWSAKANRLIGYKPPK
jgi:hypothetical protein